MKIRSGKNKAWYCIDPVKQRDGVPGLLVTIKRQGIQVQRANPWAVPLVRSLVLSRI